MERVYYLNDWDEFSSKLRETVVETRLDPNRTLIRLCPRKSLQKLLETGTDRDDNSRVWNHPLDAQHKTKINPAQIFYAWMLDITKEPMIKTYEGIIHQEPFDPFAPICAIDTRPDFVPSKDISPGQIIALYDSNQIRRLSVCEYMFCGNPQNALCCVFTLKKDTCDTPQLSYYYTK